MNNVQARIFGSSGGGAAEAAVAKNVKVSTSTVLPPAGSRNTRFSSCFGFRYFSNLFLQRLRLS
ncbi:hypothetical protein TYRP_018477 [Tyrophagus putrescentiae]|nr:hypothetical protein TYRP_018477 [Tyrophagus putrescentiae]